MIIYEDSEYAILVNSCAAPRRTTATAWEYLAAPKRSGVPVTKSTLKKPSKRLIPQARKKIRVAPEATEKPPPSNSQVEATQQDEDDEMPNEKKREAPNDTETEPDKTSGTFPESVPQAKLQGWSKKDAGGDGDCFFKAFVTGDAYARDKQDTPEKVHSLACNLRVQAVKHIKSHRADFEACWAHDFVEKQYERAGLPAPKSFQDFLGQASQRTYWANNFLIQAVASRTGIPIVIWSLEETKASDDSEPVRTWFRSVFSPKFQSGFAVSKVEHPGVVLVLRNKHYKALLPPKDNKTIPKPWLRESHEQFAYIGGAEDACFTPNAKRQRFETASAPRWGRSTPASSLRWGPATPSSRLRADGGKPLRLPQPQEVGRPVLVKPATERHQK